MLRLSFFSPRQNSTAKESSWPFTVRLTHDTSLNKTTAKIFSYNLARSAGSFRTMEKRWSKKIAKPNVLRSQRKSTKAHNCSTLAWWEENPIHEPNFDLLSMYAFKELKINKDPEARAVMFEWNINQIFSSALYSLQELTQQSQQNQL